MNDSPHPQDSSVIHLSASVPRVKKSDCRRKPVIIGRETVLTYVGVSENESLAQLVLVPVHLTTNDTEQSLAVNQDLDAILLHDLIESTRLIHVLQMVGKARATLVLDPYSNHLRAGL